MHCHACGCADSAQTGSLRWISWLRCGGSRSLFTVIYSGSTLRRSSVSALVSIRMKDGRYDTFQFKFVGYLTKNAYFRTYRAELFGPAPLDRG